MTNYFIHFHDLGLNSLKLYSYNSSFDCSTQELLLKDVHAHINNDGNLFIMLPSSLFGFKKSNNSLGLKNEVLKANILSEAEDHLISDISSLKFFYHESLELASWVDGELFQIIANKFNDFDLEIFIYPEHFLSISKNNTIHISHDSFICSFDDMTGYSGPVDSFSSYLSVLKSENINLTEFKFFKEKNSAGIGELDEFNLQIFSIEKLHADFLNSNFNQFNFFKQKLSLPYLKSKLKLTYFEASAVAASILILLIVPLAIPFFISNSINSYQDQTVKIFKQLDPNFKKIVNAQAQIDNLTKGTPLQSRASNQNLVLLKYLDQLNDPSFKEIEIDLGTRSIDVLMEGLPSYKLELIREILKLESLVLNDDALIEKDNKIYGNLLVTYDS